jgi:2-polyprenyl-6-methoxyphenol hydroxylase-like FAD-dependent oxidoreductase
MDAPAPAPTVLIVGTGPAGLFAACELVRHGVKPRIVERRLAPHHETRGTALQPGVLEIIDRGGLIEPFLRGRAHQAGATARPRFAGDRDSEFCRDRLQI